MESRVELFARIRRDARVEGSSVRALAVRQGFQKTVREAIHDRIRSTGQDFAHEQPFLAPLSAADPGLVLNPQG